MSRDAVDRDVDVGGLRLRVREAGQGAPLLLIHGLGASRELWSGTIARFADTWRVIACDLPGHGESDKPDVAYTPAFFADVIRRLGERLDVASPVVLGTSLGGRITLELAATHPAWVRAIALSAPARVMGGAWAPLGAVLSMLPAAPIVRRTLPRGIERGFFDPAVPGAATRRAMVVSQLARPDAPDFARAVGRSLAGLMSGAPPPLARITHPVLLLWGRNDRIVDPGGAPVLQAALPQAKLVLLDRCGHVPMLERPDAFHGALAEFLQTVALAPDAARAAAGGR